MFFKFLKELILFFIHHKTMSDALFLHFQASEFGMLPGENKFHINTFIPCDWQIQLITCNVRKFLSAQMKSTFCAYEVQYGNILPKFQTKCSLFEEKIDIFVLHFQKFCTL